MKKSISRATKRQTIKENKSMSNKSLSYLIEAELEKATVLMAAQSITDKLQKVAEDLAKLGPNDLMPLGDSMRDLFGADQASKFEKTVKEKLDSLVEQIRDAHFTIADQIDALKNGEEMSDIAQADPDTMFGQDEADASEDMADDMADVGADDLGMGDENAENSGAGEDDMDIDMGDLEDAFGDVGAAGRPTKESFSPRGRKLKESNGDVKLVKEFSGLLREGKTPAKAAQIIAESYAIDLNTLVGIISKVKKG